MGNSRSKICEDAECNDRAHQKRRYKAVCEEIKAYGNLLHGQEVYLGYRWKFGPEKKPPFEKWNTWGKPTHIVWEAQLFPVVGTSVGTCYSAKKHYALNSAQFTFWATGTPSYDKKRPWCYWTCLRVLLLLREAVIKAMVAKFGQKATDKAVADYRHDGVKQLKIVKDSGSGSLAEWDEKKPLLGKSGW